MYIGPFELRNNLIVAPMAGVTDRPFRQLCKMMGAGMAVSEMVASNSLLWGSEKTRRRANHDGEVDPISVQIAGADPQMLADAARYNVDEGAQIIDINMGSLRRKCGNVMAGSALLKDEPLVARILDSVCEPRRRAGHAQDPHGLGSRQPQCRDRRENRRGERHPCAGDSRPHAGVRFSGEAEYERHNRRSQIGAAHPGHRERRYRQSGAS